MSRIPAISALILTFILLSTRIVAAQDAPAGACMIPSGDWCWPIAPLTYGDLCECTTADGNVVEGEVQ